MKTTKNSSVGSTRKTANQNYLSVKKIVFILACIAITMSTNAQDSYYYYKMRTWDESAWLHVLRGDGEWLANSKKWLDYWGIQFASGSKVRATLNNSGSWYFAAPSSSYDKKYFNDINTRLLSRPDFAITTDKEIGARAFVLANIGQNNNGYGEFFLGRNNDPTLITLSTQWLRLGSPVGIAMWGSADATRNDSPHVFLANDGSLYVQNNLKVLGINETDGLYFKRGRNGDPTIRVCNNSWFRIGGKMGIYFWGHDNVEADNNPTLSIVGTRVGIGAGGSPEWALDVRGGIQMVENNIKVLVTRNATSTTGWVGTISNHGFSLGANNGEAIHIDPNQRIYLGLTMSQISSIKNDLKNKYDLFVDKGILSEDYAIAPKSTWSDFVFSEDYKLPSLSSVADFITEKKHLPDVPSAKDVSENGYSQHDMNKVLLQKIEELMLYTIEQNEKITRLESQLNNLKYR